MVPISVIHRLGVWRDLNYRLVCFQIIKKPGLVWEPGYQVWAAMIESLGFRFITDLSHNGRRQLLLPVTDNYNSPKQGGRSVAAGLQIIHSAGIELTIRVSPVGGDGWSGADNYNSPLRSAA